MENPDALIMLSQDLHGVGPGVASVDHHGLGCIESELELPDESGALRVTGRKVIVVVEADLSQRENLRVRQQIAQTIECLRHGLSGIVRMNPNGGVEKRMGVRQPDGRLQILRAVTGSDGHRARDSRRLCPLDNSFAVTFELRVLQMSMRID